MHYKRGFTLIELLVVIAIIGILATLVLVAVSNSQARARNTIAKSDISTMGKSVEVFKNDPAANDQVIGTKDNDFSWSGTSTIFSEGNSTSRVADLLGTQPVQAACCGPSYSYIPLVAIFTGKLNISSANVGYNAITQTSDNTLPTKINATPSTAMAYYYGTHASGQGIHGTMATGATGDGKYIDLKAGGANNCYILQAKGLSTAPGVGETNPVFAIIDGAASSYSSPPTCP